MMYLQMRHAQARGLPSRTGSRQASRIQSQIDQLNRSIDQYSAQKKQSMLRDGRTMAGFVLSFPVLPDDEQEPESRFGFSYRSLANGGALELPHWFVVLLAAILAATIAFRKKWRFSLRTLFIVITVAAVVLGTFTVVNS
jgi:hypothetical protein